MFVGSSSNTRELVGTLSDAGSVTATSMISAPSGLGVPCKGNM